MDTIIIPSSGVNIITYSGEINSDNIPHGMGVMIYKNIEDDTNIKYCGLFHNGKKHGHGLEYVYEYDGKYTLYCGEWKDDYLHKATISKINNHGLLITVYEGTLNKDGEYHGDNCILRNLSNIIIYKGSFFNGKKHGEGVEYYDNGNMKYKGIFFKDKKHGKGVEYHENGNLKYEGNFEDDLYSGKDTKLYTIDGNLSYEGDFVKGEFNGNGKEYIYIAHSLKQIVLPGSDLAKQKEGSKTTKYKGTYLNGKYHGKGELQVRLDDGTLRYIYKGSFVNGKFEGYGETSGDDATLCYHKGYWKNDMKNGRGKTNRYVVPLFNSKYDTIYDGEWKDNKKHGYGIYDINRSFKKNVNHRYEGNFIDDTLPYGKHTDNLGNVYEGNFDKDYKYHGVGKIVYKTSGKTYEGEWKDGKKHGNGKLTDTIGNHTEGIWHDDKLISKNKKRISNVHVMTKAKKIKINKIDDNDNTYIPDEYKCPISLCIMKEPVICSDGHTYDKESVVSLFATKNVVSSPKTRVTLDKNIMIPNYNLRKVIDEFINKN